MFTGGKDIQRNNEIAWKAGDQGTIATVKKEMKKNNVLVTRRTYEVKGGLFDQQLVKKGKGQVPVKSSDQRLTDKEKYGGYNKATGTYFVLVESENKKGEKIRTLEYVPLYLAKTFEKDQMELKRFLTKDRGLINPEIRFNKIKTDTLFKVDGFYMWLSGRTNTQLLFKCAVQLVLSLKEQAILKNVLKYVVRRKDNKNLLIKESDAICEKDLIELYDTFLWKLEKTIYGISFKSTDFNDERKTRLLYKSPKEDQCIVLSEILHMFQCNSASANLKLIQGPGSAAFLC
jgi:CRISPR-associated endonuclease Csn1